MMKKLRHLLKGGVLIALMLLVMKPGAAKADEPYIPKKTTYYLTSEERGYNWYLPGVKSTKSITKLKSSNKKVATVGTIKIDGTVYVQVIPKKTGKTTVSFTAKVNGKKKNYKCVATVKKYVNPFSSIKVGSTSFTKKLNTRDFTYIKLKETKKNQKVSFKLKKGWKLDWAGYYKSSDFSDFKTVKNGTKITLKKNRALGFSLINKDESRMYVVICYN